MKSRKWSWVNGNNSISPSGNYGLRGIGAATNVPVGVCGTCFWSDNRGNLWLWGGSSYETDINVFAPIFLNAMWKYIPDATCFPEGIVLANLNYQLSSTALCPHDSALIVFIGDSAITISPNNYITWLDSAHAVLKPDSTTTFTISGYSSCGSYNVQTFTLLVLNGIVNITSNKPAMCPGDTAQICAPTGFTSYIWSTGDTTTCINASSANNYNVTVSANGNCSATSNQINISIYPPTPVTVSISGDTLTGSGSNNCQWLLNGIPITGATTSVYIAQSSGTYTLQITDTNGCVATSSPVLIAGINNVLPENSITIFPNPTSTAWQLTISAELIGSTAQVFDATGRLVFQSPIRNPQSAINIPNAASGVYELRITSNNYNMVRKLVKL